MRLTTGRLAAPALFLATGLLVAAAGGATGQPGKDKEPGKGKKDKDADPKDGPKAGPKDDGPKGGPGKDAKELRKAFERITEAAQGAPAGKDAARLFEHAKAFYRAAVKAYPDEPARSRELAAAATDAVRGLEHLRRASYQPVVGLPEPPTEADGPPAPKDGAKVKGPPRPPKDGPKGRGLRGGSERGPWTAALDALTDVQDQLASAGPPSKGAVNDFFEAAKDVYRQARTAYEGTEYRKAAELARAAEAWLCVGDHLDRARWEDKAGPAPQAPEPKKKGPPPLPPLKN